MDSTDPATSIADAPADAPAASTGGESTIDGRLSDRACPFLVAAGGGWRMSVPDRDHRCAALVPATSLAPSKQGRLCLVPAHAGCATYLASMAAREARVGSAPKLERAGRWGIARTMPVVEEVGGLRAALGALAADRRTWPAIPAVLLATLAVALGLSGTWGGGAITAIASPTPTHRTAAGPTPTPSASTAASESPSTTETAAPTALPSTAPSPTPAVAYTTYKVKSGDTLYIIAKKFHTTVKAIQDLNNLSGTTLHVGQVLKIPS